MNSINSNDFSLEITSNDCAVHKFRRMNSTYYSLPNMSTYKIRLSNNRETRADAHVYIDNEKVGVWRINRYSSITIERPTNFARKFTLIKENTRTARKAGIVNGHESNGLVKVVFKPELATFGCCFMHDDSTPTFNEMTYFNASQKNNIMSCNANYSSAATGLGEKSSQQFRAADSLDQIDQDNITVIITRLVVDNDYDDDEIISIRKAYSNIPVPKEPPRLDTYDYYSPLNW